MSDPTTYGGVAVRGLTLEKLAWKTFGQSGAYNVSHYGAKGDGTTDDYDAFADAVSAASDAASNGGAAWVVVPTPDTSYLVQDAVVVSQSGVMIWVAKGTKFVRTSAATDEGIFEFKGEQTGATTTLSSSASRGTNTLSVVSESGFSVGDYIEIESAAAIGGQSPYLYGINKVKTTAAGTITTEMPIRNAYSTASTVNVRKIVPLERVGLIGGHFDAPGGTTSDCLRFEYCVDPKCIGATVTDFGNRGVIFKRCQGGLIQDCHATLGADTGNSWGITLHSCEGVVIRDSTVKEHGWDGFDLSYGSMYNMLEGCRAEDVGDVGFVVGHGLRGHHNQLIDCQAIGIGGSGFQMGNTSYSGDDDNLLLGCIAYANTADGFQIIEDSTRNRLIDCYAVEGPAKGFSIEGTANDNYLSGCWAEGNTGNGFVFTNPFTDVVECHSISNGGNGFRFNAGSNDSRAISCKARDNTAHNFLVLEDRIQVLDPVAINAGGSDNGVMVQDATDVVIRNPVCINNAAYGLRIYESVAGNCDGCRVEGAGYFSGNTTAPVTTNHDASTTFTASDTTPSVAGNTLFQTNNGSSTTITQFDDGYDSQMITVLGDANTIIQDNANIELQGATNFTMTASDTIVLRRLNGVWRELSRSAN
jgi:hypothetical protein